jgi:lipoprotein-anchoring transpeptidase ErfK/SrfK
MASRQTLIQQAKYAIHQGNKSQARALLQQAIQQDPNDFRAWLLLAGATESPEQSLHYIERAEMLNPRDPSVAKARRWAEDRLEKTKPPQEPTIPKTQKRNWWKPALWLTLALILIFGMGTAVILALNLRTTTITQNPRQIANAQPTAIVELTATATSRPQPPAANTAQPHIQTKQISAGDLEDAPRAEWTITPTPTNTPTPTPTLVPTFLSPQVGKPANRPFGVDSDEKWIDVDLTHQTLNAYEGNEIVYTTKVSTGTDDYPTVTGMFRVWLRFEKQTMDGARLGYDYYLENVPYVMYFFEDYALHGAYWHNNFGYQMSHGCVNIAPSDAGWLYSWSEYGTVVNVHH